MQITEIEKAENKLHDATLEIMKHLGRNVHIEINAENKSKTVKVKLNLSKTFKHN